jgi:DNA-binding phage protein
MSFALLNPNETVTICKIASEMAEAKLPVEFIAKSVKVASESKSGFDILLLWKEADTQDFKDRVVILLDKFFDDLEDFQTTKTYKANMTSENELDELTQTVLDYKQWLREMVNKWGGISKLSKAIGVSQPSISDFFRSASVPKKVTVDKIVNAIHLKDKKTYPSWMLLR